jgi:gas vesicle protein
MSDNATFRMSGSLTAFLVGAAVGAGVALLYAPYSGEETRNLLARRSRDLKDRVSGAVDATRDAIRDQLNRPTSMPV